MRPFGPVWVAVRYAMYALTGVVTGLIVLIVAEPYVK